MLGRASLAASAVLQHSASATMGLGTLVTYSMRYHRGPKLVDGHAGIFVLKPAVCGARCMRNAVALVSCLCTGATAVGERYRSWLERDARGGRPSAGGICNVRHVSGGQSLQRKPCIVPKVVSMQVSKKTRKRPVDHAEIRTASGVNGPEV